MNVVIEKEKVEQFTQDKNMNEGFDKMIESKTLKINSARSGGNGSTTLSKKK
jgi:hypothetical protein